jgi:hypothetical protein
MKHEGAPPIATDPNGSLKGHLRAVVDLSSRGVCAEAKESGSNPTTVAAQRRIEFISIYTS